MARADLIRSYDSQRKEFRVPIFITSDSIEGPKYAHAKHKNEFCLWLHVYVEIKKPKLIVSNKSGRPAIDFEPLPVGETFVSYLEGKKMTHTSFILGGRTSKDLMRRSPSRQRYFLTIYILTQGSTDFRFTSMLVTDVGEEMCW